MIKIKALDKYYNSKLVDYNPALHEFNNALKQIIEERSFEDFVDEFDD